ncbi:MAG: xanthine dehydrogenase family protein molybdopterin-binding subunit [Deltaproteobacteria bacterium]|nr:xanthine dehydrogenase family protein molybdopterin-binding subunit [Deltaproteobacteria bacterium]
MAQRPTRPVVGVTFPRQDAWAKVTGREIYAADLYGEGQLWAGVKRAGVPHARLLGLDTAAARELPGVEAVLTAADVAGANRQGVLQKDQPVLVDDKVRHAGDALALVVARDQETLAQALGLILPRLEPLPPVLDPAAALDPGAPLVHEKHPTGNLLLGGELAHNWSPAALAAAPAQAGGEYHLPRQAHAYLETEAGWARLGEDGHLVIAASTQTPFRDRLEVAEALGLTPDRITIEAPYPGGGFGGKDGITVQSLLGLAALACPGRPVKMWWSREESFLAGVKRHPARVTCRAGADRAGRLTALEMDVLLDTGPYDHLGGVVLTLGLEHAGGPYRIPHARLAARAAYTNNPVSGAFRGFGVPQVLAALELTVDELARELGQDPLEFRRQNLAAPGEALPSGVIPDCSHGLAECCAQMAAHPFWAERAAWRQAAGPHRRRGVGLALVLHGMGYGPFVPDVALARLELTPTGRFRLYAGVVDMGQGNHSTFVQMACHLLHQEAAAVELAPLDTDHCLPAGSSSASRTTFTFGKALETAAHELAGRLRARAADALMAPAGEMLLLPGRLRHAPTGREVPLARLAALLNPAELAVVARHRAPVSAQRPSADPALIMQGLPHVVFSFGVQAARVEVDTLTGGVTVAGFLSILDTGRRLNPQVWEQQIEGGVAQGLGYGLWEELPAPDGLAANRDFATYLLPTALDLPDFLSLAVETAEESGPFGLKGAGELPIDGPLPALGNAVADAVGRTPREFPLTPERVLALVDAAAE